MHEGAEDPVRTDRVRPAGNGGSAGASEAHHRELEQEDRGQVDRDPQSVPELDYDHIRLSFDSRSGRSERPSLFKRPRRQRQGEDSYAHDPGAAVEARPRSRRPAAADAGSERGALGAGLSLGQQPLAQPQRPRHVEAALVRAALEALGEKVLSRSGKQKG